MKITLCLLVSAALLSASIKPTRNEKIVLGTGVVFGALAHKQVGQVLKAGIATFIHPIATLKKVRAKTR